MDGKVRPDIHCTETILMLVRLRCGQSGGQRRDGMLKGEVGMLRGPLGFRSVCWVPHFPNIDFEVSKTAEEEVIVR